MRRVEKRAERNDAGQIGGKVMATGACCGLLFRSRRRFVGDFERTRTVFFFLLFFSFLAWKLSSVNLGETMFFFHSL